MSTNFYLVSGNDRDRQMGALKSEHIGKRSAGWAFTFQGSNFKTRDAWDRRLDALGSNEHIEDEYGRTVTREEFREVVEATLKPCGPHQLAPRVKDGPFKLGSAKFERDRSRNWVDGGCSFSNCDFS